ncbi:hypothetical protein Goari_023244 [Gossypium aridum]|uniref:Uncharacterized protein n=1 Tax=Gossypium aridum TaxID=34290 RepID=A0A7J8X2K1_GOSAI|nr:hypothetical protein [Gossypium aridum]
MYRNVVDVVDVEPIEGSLIRFFVARFVIVSDARVVSFEHSIFEDRFQKIGVMIWSTKVRAKGYVIWFTKGLVHRVGSALTVHGCTVTHQGEVVPPSPKGDQYDIGYGFKPYQGQGARVPLMGDGHSGSVIGFSGQVISDMGNFSFELFQSQVGQVQVADFVRLNRVGRFGLIKLGPQV